MGSPPFFLSLKKKEEKGIVQKEDIEKNTSYKSRKRPFWGLGAGLPA
jgi:hypothetical protein